MLAAHGALRIPLPKGWSRRVKAAMLHVISLARYAILSARGWAAEGRARLLLSPSPSGRERGVRVVKSPCEPSRETPTAHGWAAEGRTRLPSFRSGQALPSRKTRAPDRLAAELGRLTEEISLLREEMRIKDARIDRIDPRHRPHYSGTERMAVLELKSARGWSQSEAARRFFVEPATIASWLECVDKRGADSLVQLQAPVNKFPDFVGHLVRRLKVLCPALGKVKIAQLLGRAGLHLAASSVRRMLRREPTKPPVGEGDKNCHSRVSGNPKSRRLTAKHPDHVHHVDMTVVPTSLGMWTSWLPFALPQVWPFCWWLVAVLDHFSRRCRGAAVFKKPPASVEIRAFLGRVFGNGKPKHLVCDKGSQFWCAGFKAWCKRKGIGLRFGAVGKHGSIAVIERFVRSLKDECAQRIIVPLRRAAMMQEVNFYLVWYNGYRAHEFLRGRTPDEVYFGRPAANEAPRIEPRPKWPRKASCASPQAPIRGKPGCQVKLAITYREGRRHLPVIALTRVG